MGEPERQQKTHLQGSDETAVKVGVGYCRWVEEKSNPRVVGQFEDTVLVLLPVAQQKRV